MEKRYSDIKEDDKVLAEGCRRQDRRSQELLYRKYARKMYYVSLSYSGDREEAKDILQEAFLKVFRNIDKYRDTGSLEGWIRRIVSNTAIDHFRNHKRDRLTFTYDEILDTPASDKNEVEVISGTEEIISMVRDLPEGARIIFTLFAVEGYSHKEIASKLQISESTSKSQFRRARTLLMSKIKE